MYSNNIIFLKSLFRHWFYVHDITGSECFNSESIIRCFDISSQKKKKKKRHVDVFCSLNNIWQRLGHILTGAVSLLLKEKKKQILLILYPSNYCACCLVSQLVRHLHCWTLRFVTSFCIVGQELTVS